MDGQKSMQSSTVERWVLILFAHDNRKIWGVCDGHQHLMLVSLRLYLSKILQWGLSATCALEREKSIWKVESFLVSTVQIDKPLQVCQSVSTKTSFDDLSMIDSIVMMIIAYKLQRICFGDFPNPFCPQKRMVAGDLPFRSLSTIK